MSKEVGHYYNIYKRRDNQIICQTSGFTNDPIKIIEKKAKRYISPLVQLTVPELLRDDSQNFKRSDFMKKYKVLNPDLTSPYQGFEFELGKKYVCDDFDTSDNECSKGFYATDVEGILYSFRPDRLVFECEVFGRSKCFDQYKQRFERFTLGREIHESELKTMLQAESEKLGYNLFEACYPVNPFKIKPKLVTAHEIDLLKKWASLGDSVRVSVRASLGASLGDSVRDSVWFSVWDSVGDSVWDSVGRSVGHSVWDSVWDSVRDSVWDSVGAYISSLFPNVQFSADLSPCVELWRSGFVPSFDGETWRLHAAKGIVWEGVIE